MNTISSFGVANYLITKILLLDLGHLQLLCNIYPHPDYYHLFRLLKDYPGPTISKIILKKVFTLDSKSLGNRGFETILGFS